MKKGLIFLILLLILFLFALEGLAYNWVVEADAVELKIYFFNQEDCLTKISYLIKVDGFSKTEVVRKAVEKLLRGPESDNLFSFIPEGTKLNYVILLGETIILDFSKELQDYGGGSFNAIHIRQQFEETLYQFPFIKNIIFLVNGEGEESGVLQP